MKNKRSEKEELATLRQCAKEWDRQRREFIESDNRLSLASANQQLEIHNLTIEKRALFQALYDCQKMKKEIQDRIQVAGFSPSGAIRTIVE